jgi:outer membrane protein TolC
VRERLALPLAAVVALAAARAATSQTALGTASATAPAAAVADASTPGQVTGPLALERVTFTQAVARATERNPSVGQAAQAILRAEALLDQAKGVFRPTLYGNATGILLDDARGFDDFVTQPRSQAVLNATLSYPVLAPARWAAKSQAADQVAISRISAEETRRQVALAAAQAHLGVIAAQRQRQIALRNLETARALEDYARARLEAGKGSRLNHVRSIQERASAEGQLEVAALFVRRAQEALGVAVFAPGPVDADGEPQLAPALPAADDAWLLQRPDVRLFDAQLQAADRVVRDSWTLWAPTGNAFFTPQYVHPAGAFEPSKTWRALFQLQVPIYDPNLGPTKRARVADRESARFRLDAVTSEARAEVRVARESVTRSEQIVATTRLSSESANEALRITEIAYREGATSNIEVVQAQQAARNSEIAHAVAEDRLRQARLDLLVALGQFP